MVALPAVDYTEWPVSSIGKQRETPQPNSATTLDALSIVSIKKSVLKLVSGGVHPGVTLESPIVGEIS